ncbi:hypothetical protein NMY22_g4352 [Coprinellus aureogranulatus]|nr:hypothetical protein NMY22_g4352 [Coprinellus aureogranulatus]
MAEESLKSWIEARNDAIARSASMPTMSRPCQFLSAGLAIPLDLRSTQPFLSSIRYLNIPCSRSRRWAALVLWATLVLRSAHLTEPDQTWTPARPRLYRSSGETSHRNSMYAT